MKHKAYLGLTRVLPQMNTEADNSNINTEIRSSLEDDYFHLSAP